MLQDGDPLPLFTTGLGTGVQIPATYQEFADMFSKEDAAILPEHANQDHAIDTLPGKEPPFQPIYPLMDKELKVLHKYLDTNLAKGWIHPSKSPVGTPILFVPKKDGTLQLCVDY